MYDKLAVKNMWPHCQDIPGIMRHFPDKLPKGRLPDREYFWNVINTLNEEYVGNLIRHANGQRNAATGFKHKEEQIAVSEKMIGLLNEQPYISRKCTRPSNFP